MQRSNGTSRTAKATTNGSLTTSLNNNSSGMVHMKALPDYLHDNEFLLHYHRPQLNSVRNCLRSVFQLHTETCNIWTHLLGSLGVAVLAFYYLYFTSENWHQRLSFAVFFAGAIFCMGVSTAYHVLICHSESYCQFLAKLDYCGVVVLIVTSFVPWLHFCFYCNNFLKIFYICLVAVFGLMCMVVVMADRFRGGEFRKLRAGMFIALGLTGVLPGGHYIMTHSWDHFSFYSWLLFMAVLYIAGGVIYACRVPERFSPGTFDIWGQSHTILHICVVGGVLSCYHGASKLAHYRLTEDMECPSVSAL